MSSHGLMSMLSEGPAAESVEVLPDHAAMSLMKPGDPGEPRARGQSRIRQRHHCGHRAAHGSRRSGIWRRRCLNPDTNPESQGDRSADSMTRIAALQTEALEQQSPDVLSDRTAMSLVNPNVAVPIIAALALNVASADSLGYASATQDAPITQTM